MLANILAKWFRPKRMKLFEETFGFRLISFFKVLKFNEETKRTIVKNMI